jgi:hypothetical protein
MNRVMQVVWFTIVALGSVFISHASATCRKVEPSPNISISVNALRNLASIGISRQRIFDALEDVSIPETSGCWSGAAGDFDDQIISVGTLQWNYGQRSLQPLLRRYQEKQGASFMSDLSRLMPMHGGLIFSSGCLRSIITPECKLAILALQANGDLVSSLRNELDSLFESDPMVQIQMDRFVALLESVKDDLHRLFADQEASVRRIKWAVDTKVQQGGFPEDRDVKRYRNTWMHFSSSEKAEKLRSLLLWYEGLSRSADQGGIRLDWSWNIEKWRRIFDQEAVTNEQADLLNLSFLRSRTAQGESGYWQALAFQRRAKIILGVGSVGGNRTEN